MARRRRTCRNPKLISFRTKRGKRVAFKAAVTPAEKRTSKAKKTRRGKILAKSYGFVWKKGRLYRRDGSPRTLVLVRRRR